MIVELRPWTTEDASALCNANEGDQDLQAQFGGVDLGSLGSSQCGLRCSLAVFWWRSLSLVTYDEGAGGCFDDIVGDGFELVDLQHTGDLWEESEVAAGDPLDGGDCLSVGEVVWIEGPAESFPVPVEDD